jgi:hypothetical protein
MSKVKSHALSKLIEEFQQARVKMLNAGGMEFQRTGPLINGIAYLGMG